MAKHPMVSNYDLSSVTDIVTAAAPVSPEVCVELQERLNLENFCIRQGKALTSNLIWAYHLTYLTLVWRHETFRASPEPIWQYQLDPFETRLRKILSEIQGIYIYDIGVC